MIFMHMLFLFGTYSEAMKAVEMSGSRTLPKFARTLSVLLGMTLLAGCREGVDGRIRRAHELARRPTPANKDRIEALLKDSDRDVRATAIVLMERLDGERAKRMAQSALSDPD